MPIGQSQVTRLVNGIGTVADNNIFADFGMPDPTKWHIFFEDFLQNPVAADYTITKVGTGTTALADTAFGALLLTNTTGASDSIYLQRIGRSFLMNSAKKAFFKTRLKMSSATLCGVLAGLQINDTTPTDATDGIYFLKTAAAATFDIFVRKDASTGSNTVAAVATAVADTFIELAWYYDGAGLVYYAVDGVVKGSLSAAAAYLPDAQLSASFGLLNGSAVAHTAQFDYLFAAIER